jgi:hypothetical protein
MAVADLMATYRNQELWNKTVATEETALMTRETLRGETHPEMLEAMTNP